MASMTDFMVRLPFCRLRFTFLLTQVPFYNRLDPVDQAPKWFRGGHARPRAMAATDYGRRSMNERIEQTLTRRVWRECSARDDGGACARLASFRAEHPQLSNQGRDELPFSERDVVLITYGDQIQEPGVAPLRYVARRAGRAQWATWSTRYTFCPSTRTRPTTASRSRTIWQSIPRWVTGTTCSAWAQDFRLMFDAVINHMSQAERVVPGLSAGRGSVQRLLHQRRPGPPTCRDVVRPRTSPLLTPFDAADGVRHVWTTFSADQVDLNYADPNLLLEIVDVLLTYVEHGRTPDPPGRHRLSVEGDRHVLSAPAADAPRHSLSARRARRSRARTCC